VLEAREVDGHAVEPQVHRDVSHLGELELSRGPQHQVELAQAGHERRTDTRYARGGVLARGRAVMKRVKYTLGRIVAARVELLFDY